MLDAKHGYVESVDCHTTIIILLYNQMLYLHNPCIVQYKKCKAWICTKHGYVYIASVVFMYRCKHILHILTTKVAVISVPLEYMKSPCFNSFPFRSCIECRLQIPLW